LNLAAGLEVGRADSAVGSADREAVHRELPHCGARNA